MTMTVTTATLETRLTAGNESKGRTAISRALQYLIPLLQRYHPQADAQRMLREDADLAGYSLEAVAGALEQSAAKYKVLMTTGKIADTTDKAVNLVALVVETVGYLFGIGPGIVTTGVEEAIEYVAKIPYIAALYMKRVPDATIRTMKLAAIEAATLTPVAGDVYDFVAHPYIRDALDIIRGDAKQTLIRQKAAA